MEVAYLFKKWKILEFEIYLGILIYNYFKFILKDIVKVNKELSLMKRENINFLFQNRSIEKDISDNEELLTQLKEKNEFLSKESVKINNDIQILKEELK